MINHINLKKAIFLLFWLILAVFSLQSAQAGTLSWVSQDRWVTVKRVIDGDTFVTRKGEKVRLLGMNTPETRHRSSPAQPFGKQAKIALTTLIANQQVRLTFDREKQDKYQRTLAHVYLRGGLWVNAEMLRLGLAHVYTFTPNIAAAKKLLHVEQQAIAENKGMWGHKRWKTLTPKQLKTSMLGQFRLLRGKVEKVDKKGWKFYIGKLAVSIPRKYRKGFKARDKVRRGDMVLVRGRLRMSKKGQWFLSVHTPSDISHKIK
ncbi:MAG: thermonuclease family protein [Mariprofundaceae bacterium]|nr:thermonuclease family protein [Mariprofundaceae bacterium]